MGWGKIMSLVLTMLSFRKREKMEEIVYRHSGTLDGREVTSGLAVV